MRIAEFRESSDLWTQPALGSSLLSMFVSVCLVDFIQLNAIELSSLKGLSWKAKAWDSPANDVVSVYREFVGQHRSLSFTYVLIKKTTLQSAPEIKQEHPLNLSISVSGGKETNKDCLSSGEWRGKSSSWKSVAATSQNCNLENFTEGWVYA